MKRQITVVTFFIAICFALISTGYANSEDDFTSKKPMDIEEIYKKMGYTTDITKTINQFEEQFKTKVIIPNKMPFKVNLSFGKIEDDKTLSLDFIGDSRKDVFKLTVNPNKPFKNEDKVNYKLSNGSKVFIEEIKHEPSISQLYMEKDEFEYILGISNTEKYKKEELVKIAEFISNN